ncbi:VOC family protein [Streptosporangium soli]|nr:hypothetical protein [Streptosporangium sp. KLBMP 9127]
MPPAHPPSDAVTTALAGDPGWVIHAAARIRTGNLFFADSGPDGGRCLAPPTGPVRVRMWTTVPDAEAVCTRAIAAGANPGMEVTAQDDGTRMGCFVDPFGTLWWVRTPA